jgi:hypothetical protein
VIDTLEREIRDPRSAHRVKVSVIQPDEERVRYSKLIIVSSALGLLTALGATRLSAQAVSVCNDGTKSSAVGRGACASHGGVNARATEDANQASKKVDKADAKADKGIAKSEEKAEKSDAKTRGKMAKDADKTESKVMQQESKAVAKGDEKAEKVAAKDASGKCKDGTYTHAAKRQGACSRHGGIAEWLKK